MLAIALLFVILTSTFGEETIQYVAVIYRHGDRTPVQPYPTDPWKNASYWPVKFGELTNIGKEQHYDLGKWLRNRYKDLISSKFDPDEIYVRSTDVDRTLMSAQSNLAGMYPPSGNTIWNDNLMWQPIPIHTVPEIEDNLLAMKKPCPAYNKEYRKLLQSTPFKKRLNRYQQLMDYLSAHSGANVKMYNEIEYLYNNLYIETLYNFTLPNWTKAVYPDKMIEPACYSFIPPTGTSLLKRLKTGPLLKEIVTQMMVASNATNSSKVLKMSVYSGHDDTIGNVLNSLDMFDGRCPPYTSTILMELVQDGVGSKFVKIWYRNFTEIKEPNLLYIPNCGKTCPLERFIKLYKNLILVDWEDECNRKVSTLIGGSFIAGILLCAVVFMMNKFYFVWMTKQHTPYEAVDFHIKSRNAVEQL